MKHIKIVWKSLTNDHEAFTLVAKTDAIPSFLWMYLSLFSASSLSSSNRKFWKRITFQHNTFVTLYYITNEHCRKQTVMTSRHLGTLIWAFMALFLETWYLKAKMLYAGHDFYFSFKTPVNYWLVLFCYKLYVNVAFLFITMGYDEFSWMNCKHIWIELNWLIFFWEVMNWIGMNWKPVIN